MLCVCVFVLAVSLWYPLAKCNVCKHHNNNNHNYTIFNKQHTCLEGMRPGLEVFRRPSKHGESAKMRFTQNVLHTSFQTRKFWLISHFQKEVDTSEPPHICGFWFLARAPAIADVNSLRKLNEMSFVFIQIKFNGLLPLCAW